MGPVARSDGQPWSLTPLSDNHFISQNLSSHAHQPRLRGKERQQRDRQNINDITISSSRKYNHAADHAALPRSTGPNQNHDLKLKPFELNFEAS